MKRKYWLFCLTLCMAVVSIQLTFAGPLEADAPKPRVLFLSSYTLSFDTLPAQLKGIEAALPADDYVLDTEFMDTKRFSRTEDEKRFYAMLKSKMDRLPRYDAVILGDDAALLFGLEHQQELFADTPMVFLGINSTSLAMEAARTGWITGVAEQVDYRRNLDMIQLLFPGTRNIIAITDNTLTALGDQQQFLACMKGYPGLNFSWINASECTRQELAERIAAVDGSSVLIYMNLFEDKEQHVYTIESGASFIADYARVPVLRFSMGGVGRGILGGIMISFEESGRLAGNMVRDILQGRPPSQIPVVMESPTYGYFDQRLLDRYFVPDWKLPAGSRVINREPRFIDTHRELCITASVVLLFLFTIIGMLWISARRRKRLMNEDYLTKLHNRMWMMERIQTLLDKKEACALLMFDLDGFKHVNDSYGHMAGDLVLRETGRRLQQALGEGCSLARLGGDEFIGLVTGTDHRVLVQTCEQVMEVCREPFLVDGQKLRISLSLGIACAPEDSTECEQLMTYADAALYAVKTSGKCGYRFFDAKLRANLERELQVQQLLDEALEQDGFQLVYQPQFQAVTRKLNGFEALLRLRNGKALPGEFIPVAEQSRMILTLGRLVVAKAVKQMAEWQWQGYAPVTVAVNFSNQQLLDKDYPEYVRALLEIYEIPPGCLEIEVTESLYLDPSEKTRQFMRQLLDLGAKLSVDDFGSGYSAISYLSHVAFSHMKLDKGLLDCYEDTGDSRMIAGIIQLAHSLGLTVTAEGVEKQSQLEMLAGFGCDYIQGYLLGRPMLPEEAERLMKTEAVARRTSTL